MQLTRFDRWLREKFVYQLHIQTLRLPEYVPQGVQAFDLPDAPGRRYRHLFIASNSKAADKLIRVLKENNQMYATQIVDREAWYVSFIAPKDKSVTWWLFSAVVIVATIAAVVLGVSKLAEDPDLRENFREAIEILKS